MIGDLFDSPWKIAIIAVLIIVLFGTAKLPVFARSLGKSMRILKKEVTSLHGDDDESESTAAPAPAALQAPAAPAAPVAAAPVAPVAAVDQQAQIDALSKQLAELKQTVNTPDGAQAK
jgi:sec-independent protein translocase protein TatA